jgi:hypothetical protein
MANVKIYNSKIGAESEVPESAVKHYEAKGWSTKPAPKKQATSLSEPTQNTFRPPATVDDEQAG